MKYLEKLLQRGFKVKSTFKTTLVIKVTHRHLSNFSVEVEGVHLEDCIHKLAEVIGSIDGIDEINL